MRCVAIAVFAFAMGCGDDAIDDSGVPDGAAADGSTGAGSVALPQIPWLDEGVPPIAPPDLACPDGWRSVSDDVGAATCDPYPAGGAEECPPGEAHFPGEPGCAPIGTACPTGDYADDLPADATITYVEPGAMGGNGSIGAPYGSVGEFSVGGLPRDSVIALARGVHDGPFRLVRGVTLWGACVSETSIRALTPAPLEAVVRVVNDVGVVRNLTIADSPRLAMQTFNAELTVDGVAVEAATGIGILNEGDSTLTARSVVFDELRPMTADGRFGRAVSMQTGSRGEVTRAILDGSHDFAVYVNDPGSALVLRDAVVRNTAGRASDLLWGNGISANDGTTVEVSRTLLENNRNAGIGCEGCAITSTDVVIRDTRPQLSDDVNGVGATVWGSGAARFTRALFERNRAFGIYTAGPGTMTTLEDVVIRGTTPMESDQLLGYGLHVQEGATLEGQRVEVARSHSVGVAVIMESTRLAMEDLTIRGTEPQVLDGSSGRGLYIDGGARATLSNALVDDNHDLGVYVNVGPTAIELTDVVIRNTRPQESDGEWGRGLQVEQGATVVALRTVIEGNQEVGLSTSQSGTSVTLEDVVIRDTHARDLDGRFGRALNSQSGSVVNGTRVLVQRAAEAGVFVAGPDTRLTLTDLTVQDSSGTPTTGHMGRGMHVQEAGHVSLAGALFARNRELSVAATGDGTVVEAAGASLHATLERACAESTCVGAGAGHGLGAYRSATVLLTDFSVADAAICGVHLDSAEVDLVDGSVTENPIGACVQGDGYDLSRLQQRVTYQNNGTNLQSTSLPIPESLESL